MAEASSSSPTQILFEELQCPICLSVFTDPVSTPCGHNFCKSCLNQCWNNSQTYSCPFCKETFNKRPELKINTTLRDVAQLFKQQFPENKSEVLCDICDGIRMKALKFCLVCQNSYCQTHLEPHQRVPNLKKHKLIEPLLNLENYICQKHEKHLELFCRDDQTCVCLLCAVTDHRNHDTVIVEEESKERMPQLIKIQTDVQQMIQDRMKTIKDIKHSVDHKKKTSEKEKAEITELFADLMRCIERCQSELLGMIEKNQKAAEKQAEELIKELEKEITELKKSDAELEQLSHTDDHLHLLQIYPEVSKPPRTRSWTHISIIDSQLSVETLRRSLAKLQETLEVRLTKTVLKKIQQNSVDVTLDPDTAYSKLILTDDGKQVTCGDAIRELPANPKRFDGCCSVLAKEGFSSGKFYYEIQVKGKTDWDFGVARESINRKGKITGSPMNGFWIIVLRNGNQYKARESPSVSLSLRAKLQVVGVFVDYDEGLVSFYDVENKSLIYSFTGQTFAEKILPYFSPGTNNEGKNAAPLSILNVKHNI